MATESETPRHAAARALEFVSDGMIVGLGTGRAATAFVEALGARARDQGWRIRCVATSRATATLAQQLALPLIQLDSSTRIDVTVDGADEVDPEFNVIKGLGGALLREKVLALCSTRWVLCVGEDKRVDRLGQRGVVPVEVVPFAEPLCERLMRDAGFHPQQRRSPFGTYVTDNGNHILDCHVGPMADPLAAHQTLREMTGVIETGLFLGMSPIVITQRGDTVEVSEPGN